MAAEFRDGQSIKPHVHSWGQLIYAVRGVITVWTAEGSWVVPPQWAVWAAAGVSHGMRFHGPASLRTLYLRPELVCSSFKSTAVSVSPLLRELILRTAEIAFLDDREPLHEAMARLIVNELRTHPATGLDLPMPASGAVVRIARHLLNSPQDRSGHAELARRFGFGARTLERRFLAETGLPLGQWRKQARFLHALRCLGNGGSVKETAAEAGYGSASAFIAAFRAAFHTTPSRYFRFSG